jgi:hypothetical protein
LATLPTIVDGAQQSHQLGHFLPIIEQVNRPALVVVSGGLGIDAEDVIERTLDRPDFEALARAR